MTVFSYRWAEYDPDYKWLVIATGRDSVDLPSTEDFRRWVAKRWPKPRYEARREL